MAIKRVFQKEPVLSIAACLALVSSCFVLPDAEYLGYIDFRTLAILFSLMTVMAGLRGQGVFDRLGRALLSHTRTTLQLTAVLVGLCFFSSMVITNDVSLLTFVPFTFVVVNSLDGEVYVYNMHIAAYEKGNIFNKDPLRVRKLLLHKREIRKIEGQIAQKGYTVVPLSVYFSGSLVKVEIGLAKGKKLYDKRQDIAKKDQRREAERKFKNLQF